MTAATLTGRVDQITLTDSEMGGHRTGSSIGTGKRVEATILLEDGRKAYVQTTVGEQVLYPYLGPMGSESYQPGNTDVDAAKATDGRWPWAIDSGLSVATPTPGSPFEGSPTAIYMYSRPVLTVWRDDTVTLRGTVEERLSRAGHNYLVVKRAKVLKLDRPRESQGRE